MVWDFIPEVNPFIKCRLNLEVKNGIKLLISIEVIIFVTYH